MIDCTVLYINNINKSSSATNMCTQLYGESNPMHLWTVSAETILDYKPEVLLAGLVWEKNIILAYNSHAETIV